MFCWWPLHPGRFPPQLCFAVWFVLNFYVTPSRCGFHPLLKPHSHRLGLLAYVISCFCAPTASAEDKRLYTDAIVTYELMHIGHGVDSERLDPVFPPACAFNAAASFLFAKVRQSEMTFFYTWSTCKQNSLTCRSDRRYHHQRSVVFFAASVEKNATLLHVMCNCGSLSSWRQQWHAFQRFWLCAPTTDGPKSSEWGER